MGTLDGLKPVVATIINTFGTSATFKSEQRGTGFDSTTGSAPKPTDLTRDVKVIISEYTKNEMASGFADETGSTIQAGDRKLIAAVTAGAEPKAGDHFIVDGLKWRIVEVKVTRGTDESILWECRVQR